MAEKEEKKEKPKFPKRELVIPKTTAELQKLHVDALMRDVSKPAKIPDARKERGPRPPPESVRWVPGSSAGAGSSEFHIYRNLRDHENKRQEHIDKKAKETDLDTQFQRQREAHIQAAEDKTAKKRAKRQRKKQLKEQAKKMKKLEDGSKDPQEPKSDGDSGADSDGDEESGPSIVVGGK
ncbi:PRKR-interacting protein 1-like [Sycon ciliatum]|uniref:PRKR-interacting protein 1-like n=1 Tax=Sycon ciliatum TaxID=27933 RepID=UPI0031F6A939|eukprot:scpid12340/ scgid29544/ PRKR-interacting protein 1 &gt; PRKR-interacting protein 1